MIYEQMTDEAFLIYSIAAEGFGNVIKNVYADEFEYFYDSVLAGYAEIDLSSHPETFSIENDGKTCLPIRKEPRRNHPLDVPLNYQYYVMGYSVSLLLFKIPISEEYLEQIQNGVVPRLNVGETEGFYSASTSLTFGNDRPVPARKDF